MFKNFGKKTKHFVVGTLAVMVLGGVGTGVASANTTCGNVIVGSNGRMTCANIIAWGTTDGVRVDTNLQGVGQVQSRAVLRQLEAVMQTSQSTWNATTAQAGVTGLQHSRRVDGTHSWRSAAGGTIVTRNTVRHW